MAGPYKRPYPGEWVAPDHSQEKMGRADPYQSMYYSGMQWGQQQNMYGAGTGAPETTKANIDFTDDYSAFYGNPQSNNYRGGYGGWTQGQGQYRGQGWGRGGGYSNRGGSNGNQNQMTQNGNQGNAQGGYQGHNNIQVQNNAQGGQGSRGRGFGGRGNQGGWRGRGRGMPPNQFGGRGRGRGGKPTTSVPPVHSLAKTKPTFPDISQMSVAEKMHRFCLYLRNENIHKVNAIQTIVNATTSSRLGLKLDFESSELAWLSHQKLYTGSLKIEEVFIARSVALNKKELKQSTFDKALKILTTNTVAEIYHLTDPGPEAMRDQIAGAKKEKEPETATTVGVPPTDLKGALQNLVNGVKNMKTVPDNAISHVEHAIIQTHTVVANEYSFEANKYFEIYYTGKFTFAGVTIGRGQGMSKKACKKQTYQQTLDRLMTLSIDELTQDVPELPVPEVSVEVANKKKPPHPRAAVQTMSVEERFKETMNHLSGMNISGNLINPIDVTAMTNGLFPMLIFKPCVSKDKIQSFVCDLYIEKIFLATGEALKKKESMVNAYSAAWDILTTSSAEEVLKDHRRITPEEMKSPHIMDIVFKGTGKSIESNLAGLKKFGFNTNELNKKLDDLVLIEHKDWSDNRLKNSFCILQFSCSQNGVYMQWETIPVAPPYIFKCTMTIGGQVMGESHGYSKILARNFAATDALFRLYENHNIIKIVQRQYEDNWIPYDDIKTEAEALRVASNSKETPPETDEKGNPLPDPFVSKVVEKRLTAFAASNKTETCELVFGPGFTDAEWRDFRQQARTLNLKYENRQNQGKHYYLVYERLEWDALAKILRKKGNRWTGKFELVPENEKPKYTEVEGKILKEQPALKEPRKTKKYFRNLKEKTEKEVKEEKMETD